MKNQKTSNYNIVFDKDKENVWVFNSISGSMLGIKPEVYDLLKENKINEIKERDGGIFANLKKNGIILDEDLDEIKLLKYMYWKTKFSPDRLNLSLTITKDCNFDCRYCYENKEKISFSDDLINRIVKLVDKRKKTIRHLDIGWFGGEPMMRMDIIKKMTERFKTICEQNDIMYSAYITTNGYFLNLANFEKLLDYNVRNIQVTIDGPREYHDKLRPLKNGGGTYNKIISNLLEIRSKYSIENLPEGFAFSVRVNISEMNRDVIKKWIESDFPEKLKDLVDIYFSEVFSDGEEGSAASVNAKDNNIFSINGISPFDIIRLHKSADQMGYNVTYDLKPKFIYCGADYHNSYTILSDGRVGKCGVAMETFGKMGDNGEILIDNQGEYIEWMAKDPFTFKGPFKECEKCSLLPICMGGCSRILKKFHKTGCFVYKDSINENLKLMRDNLLKS